MRIAVVGATGVIGSLVVDAAERRGHDVLRMSRSSGVDLVTGRGLDRALTGVEVVVDVSNVSTLSERAAVAFFTSATGNLLRAEEHAGVSHHVLLSIVGARRAPVGYYAGKAAQEGMVEAGSVPWTILAATQFHEFAAQTARRSTLGPLLMAPRMRTQPVAAREVAVRLADLIQQTPQERVPSIAGPREEELSEMVRAYARAHRRRGWIPAVSIPGAFGRAMRQGALLPEPGAQLGTQTFGQWLGEQTRS